MEILPLIQKAYKAEDLGGSFLTSPLRGYPFWIQERMEECQNFIDTLVWKVLNVALSLFAYPVFGFFAFIGVAINLFPIVYAQKKFNHWEKEYRDFFSSDNKIFGNTLADSDQSFSMQSAEELGGCLQVLRGISLDKTWFPVEDTYYATRDENESVQLCVQLPVRTKIGNYLADESLA